MLRKVARPHNSPMASSPWQRCIQRAQELSAKHDFAGEMLGFYIQLARFQDELHRRLNAQARPAAGAFTRELAEPDLSLLAGRFESFLRMVEAHGPGLSVEVSRDLQSRGARFWSEMLQAAWTTSREADARGVLVRAFLQPYAELVRSHAARSEYRHTYAICSFCSRKPALGVMRQLGDGGARSLICSFCLAEWEFRRIVCPGCGEEDEKKLPVFTASEFDYIRVECCDSCKTYIKTIDLTKNGRAEPVVDELASAPLDLWARERSFAKLQSNVLGN